MKFVHGKYVSDYVPETPEDWALLRGLLYHTSEHSWEIGWEFDETGKVKRSLRGRFVINGGPFGSMELTGTYEINDGKSVIYSLPVHFTAHLRGTKHTARMMWHSDDGRSGWIWEHPIADERELKRIFEHQQKVNNLRPVPV